MNLCYPYIFQRIYGSLDGDFEQVKNFADSLKGNKILEVGAGNGRLIPVLSSYETTLVEPDEVLYKELVEKSKDFKNIKTIKARSFKLPFKEKSFDGILFPFMVLSEATPILATLTEALRVLKDDGKLYIWQANPDNITTKSNSCKSFYDKDGIICGFDSKTINIKSYGDYEYETYFQFRSKSESKRIVIRQTIPPEKYYRNLFKELSLKIESLQRTCFNEDENKLIFTVKKDRKKHSSSKVKALYDNISDSYRTHLNQSKYFFNQWARENLNGLKDTFPRILDLGCGDGEVGKVFEEIGIIPSESFGIDISQEMLDRCICKDWYTSTMQYDLNQDFPLIKQLQFDLVTMIGTSEFIENVDELIKNIRGTLVIGGELIVTFNAISTEDNGPKVDKSRDLQVRRYNEQDLLKTFKKANLRIVNMEQKIGYKTFSTSEDVPYFVVTARREKL